MTTKTSEKAFLILSIMFILTSGNIVLISAQENSNVVLKVSITPSSIEQTENTHKIGYVWLENKAGNPISLPRESIVNLESDNPSIASVMNTVTIPTNSQYSTFEITTHNVKGEAKIFASYNDQLEFGIITIGDKDVDIENDLRLVINLPTSEMNVNSQMPFSFYLQNSDGEITQAPFDIPVTIEYEESLVSVESQDLTIKKGNSYVWGTISTHDKVGNAFIRASADKLGFDEAKEIKISSSLPSSLAVNIFPEKVPATLKRDLDVIVSLVDSDGLPTLAQEDVKLEFFSDDVSINNQIDRKIKEESLKGVIKKGEFSYHFTQRLDFFKENQTITIGASTKGLGVSTDTFETVKPITTNNPIAENKTLATFTLGTIPTKSQTVAVYQIGMLVDDEDEETTTESITSEETKKVFFPLIVNENYDSAGSEQKINIISSNDLLLKVKDAGQISASSSYGSAVIETGQETGQVLLSSTIKGIGSSSTVTQVINTLKQEQTMLFSPTGTDSILFDNNGRFDFFVISLDTKGRPTLVENEIRYLITPINEIVTIQKAKTFAHVNFQGNVIQSENEDTMNIKTVPIGESADVRLEAQNTFTKEPTAKISITLPFKTINQNSKYSGIIQVVDFNNNPIILNDNLRVKISASDLGMLETPESVTIPAGISYVDFPVTTTDKVGTTKILASGKGIVESESEIEVKTLTTKLKISFGSVIEPITLEEPTELKVYVDDEAQNGVSGATIKVISSDSSIASNIITTDAQGIATVQFNAQKSPKTSLQILASAEGYSEDAKTIEFAVNGAVENTRTELPSWIIYAAVGGIVAIGGGIFAFLRKPKKIQDEDEIYD